MKLYKPVLIESAEQAKALPPKAVVVNIDERTGDPWAADLREDHPAETLVPIKGDHYIALVPIEAEEETTERHRLCQPVPDVLHRYTTPWTLHTPKETP